MAFLELVGLGLGGLSALQGSQNQRRADRMNARQLAFDEERWRMGEPLRNMAMQGLGRAFQPIDMGNHMYDSANPYAAARGPRASNATIGNMGDIGFTLPPNFAQQTREQMAFDNAEEAANRFARMGGAHGDMGRKLQQRLAGSRPSFQSVGYGWER